MTLHDPDLQRDAIVFSIILFIIGCGFQNIWLYLPTKIQEDPLTIKIKNIFTWLGLTGGGATLLLFIFLALNILDQRILV